MASTQTSRKEEPKLKPQAPLETHKVDAPSNGHQTAEAKPERLEAKGPQTIEKKITTAVVIEKKVKASMVENGPIQLYSIIGICTGRKVGESNYGVWVGFTGQFEAVRFDDGKRFTSPVAFIPEPASSMMNSAIDECVRNGQDVNLRFAFIIGAKASDKAATGYEYTVQPVQSAAQNDALAELRALVAPHRPAISLQS